MSVFITGDVHGDIRTRFSPLNFPHSFLSKGDNYVIVCGDFGGIWNGSQIEEKK